MRKVFLLSALAALACARTWVQSFNNEEEPFKVLYKEGLFDITQDYNIELLYKLFYKNEVLEDDDGVNKESIGFKVASDIRVTYYATFFDYFVYELTLNFIPFEVTQLEAGLYYTIPSAYMRGDPGQAYIKFSYS